MERLPNFRRRLLAWFKTHRRLFPWRETDDPYAVWVSEIMLQQTTTETVRGYFSRFCERFPDVRTLAAADEHDVLALWQGLGYYRRARQMHRAARGIVEHFGGVFPNTLKELLTLPGVGRYTAGAIRSFAFNLPAPILEANTARLYARLMALTADPALSAAQKRLWSFAETILPRRNCGDFNQALLDLGNGVCGPGKPNCSECPVFEYCEAHRLGKTGEIPPPKKRAAKTVRFETAVLARLSRFERGRCRPKEPSSERFLFVRYPETLRWGGLWDFPRFERPDFAAGTPNAPIESLQRFFGCNVRFMPGEAAIRHVVTRFHIELSFGEAVPVRKADAYFWRTRAQNQAPVIFAGGATTFDLVEFRWLTLDEASLLAMSTTARRLLAIARTMG